MAPEIRPATELVLRKLADGPMSRRDINTAVWSVLKRMGLARIRPMSRIVVITSDGRAMLSRLDAARDNA